MNVALIFFMPYSIEHFGKFIHKSAINNAAKQGTHILYFHIFFELKSGIDKNNGEKNI